MKFSDVFTGLGRPVVYYPSLNAITGGVGATVFLANLFQWSGTQRDPDGWIYKTQEEIEAETGLSRREQETARKQLRAATLLREERRGVPARLYYLIQIETLNAAWEEFLANKNGGNRQTGSAECAILVRRIPPDYPYRVNYPEQTEVKEAQSAEKMWEELAELNIPDVAAYIRTTGRGPFNDPQATVDFARRKLSVQDEGLPYSTTHNVSDLPSRASPNPDKSLRTRGK
jgi:hypothetical protein